MTTLDELLAQPAPNEAGQIVPPGKPPMGMSLDDMLKLPDPTIERDSYPGDSVSSLRSEPLTELEEARQRLNELIDRTPVKKQRSTILPAVLGTTGSMLGEFSAVKAAQHLPPRLKFLGIPIKIAGAIAGAFTGGYSAVGYQQLASDDIREGSWKEQVTGGLREARDEILGQGGGSLVGRVLSGGLPGVKGTAFPDADRLSGELTEAGKRIAPGSPVALQRDLSDNALKALHEGKAGLTEGERGHSSATKVEKFIRSAIGGGRLNTQIQDLNPAALDQLKREMVDRYWNDVGGRENADDVANEIGLVLDNQFDSFRNRFSTAILNGKKPLDSQVVGDVVQASRDTVSEYNRKNVSAAYKDVEELALQSGIPDIEVGSIVPLDETIRVATEGFEKWDKKPRNTKLKDEMTNLYLEVLTGPSKTTIEDADKGLRGDLLAKARDLLTPGTRSLNPTKSAAIKDLADAARIDLKTSLDRFDPAINEALLTARTKAAKNIQLEQHPFVKKMHTLLDSSQPEKLINHIFRDGSPSGIELAQRALGKETVAELGDTWLNKQMTEAMANKQSIGIDFKKRLNKLGRPSLDKIYGKNKTNDLYAVASGFKKEGSKFLENKVVKSAMNLVEGNPKLVAHRIIQKDNTKLMAKWREKLGPKRFEKVQAVWLDDAISKGNFSNNLNDLGDKMLKETFNSPGHLEHLQDIARLDRNLGLTGDGSSVLAKLIQASSLTAFITAPGTAIKSTAGLVGGGMYSLGRLMAHKPSAKWIARGVDDPRKLTEYTRRAVTELGRHTRALVQEAMREKGTPFGGPASLEELQRRRSRRK